MKNCIFNKSSTSSVLYEIWDQILAKSNQAVTHPDSQHKLNSHSISGVTWKYTLVKNKTDQM